MSPILSMPNSYSTNLSKTLDHLFKPFILTGISLKDSFQFVDSLKNITVLVSFNVISLFSKVPLQDTIKHICSCIDFNQFPVDKATLSKLLTLACKDMLFHLHVVI